MIYLSHNENGIKTRSGPNFVNMKSVCRHVGINR